MVAKLLSILSLITLSVLSSCGSQKKEKENNTENTANEPNKLTNTSDLWSVNNMVLKDAAVLKSEKTKDFVVLMTEKLVSKPNRLALSGHPRQLLKLNPDGSSEALYKPKEGFFLSDFTVVEEKHIYAVERKLLGGVNIVPNVSLVKVSFNGESSKRTAVSTSNKQELKYFDTVRIDSNAKTIVVSYTEEDNSVIAASFNVDKDGGAHRSWSKSLIDLQTPEIPLDAPINYLVLNEDNLLEIPLVKIDSENNLYIGLHVVSKTIHNIEGAYGEKLFSVPNSSKECKDFAKSNFFLIRCLLVVKVNNTGKVEGLQVVSLVTDVDKRFIENSDFTCGSFCSGAEIHAMEITNDHIYVGGRFRDPERGNFSDIVLVKLEKDNLNLNWKKSLVLGSNGSVVQSINIHDNSILIGGATNWTQTWNGASIGATSDLFLMQLDENGNQVKEFPIPKSKRFNQLRSILMGPKGTPCISGLTNGPSSHANEKNPELIHADGFFSCL